MKAFTDLEQSKKLAEILPIESADMIYMPMMEIDSMSNSRFFNIPECYPFNEFKDSDTKPLPCWSLAALLELLPYEIKDKEGTIRFFELYRGYREQYHIIYTGADEDIEGEYYDNFVDACVDMIIKLNELKML